MNNKVLVEHKLVKGTEVQYVHYLPTVRRFGRYVEAHLQLLPLYVGHN